MTENVMSSEPPGCRAVIPEYARVLGTYNDFIEFIICDHPQKLSKLKVTLSVVIESQNGLKEYQSNSVEKNIVSAYFFKH